MKKRLVGDRCGKKGSFLSTAPGGQAMTHQRPTAIEEIVATSKLWRCPFVSNSTKKHTSNFRKGSVNRSKTFPFHKRTSKKNERLSFAKPCRSTMLSDALVPMFHVPSSNMDRDTLQHKQGLPRSCVDGVAELRGRPSFLESVSRLHAVDETRPGVLTHPQNMTNPMSIPQAPTDCLTPYAGVVQFW